MYAPPAEERAESKRPTSRLARGCGGVVLLGGLGIGGCVMLLMVSLGPPADATKAFFQKISEGQHAAAYEDTTDRLRADLSREQFEALFAGLNVTDVTLNNRNVQNDTATMSGTVTLDDAPRPPGPGAPGRLRSATYGVVVVLLSVGDDWKINGIHGELVTALQERPQSK